MANLVDRFLSRVHDALMREDVQIEVKDVGFATAKVVEAVARDSSLTVAPVKSPAASAINWTQIIAIIASVLVLFGINIPLDTQLAFVALIQAAQSVLTFVLRTWFSPSVTTTSVGK